MIFSFCPSFVSATDWLEIPEGIKYEVKFDREALQRLLQYKDKKKSLPVYVTFEINGHEVHRTETFRVNRELTSPEKENLNFFVEQAWIPEPQDKHSEDLSYRVFHDGWFSDEYLGGGSLDLYSPFVDYMNTGIFRKAFFERWSPPLSAALTALVIATEKDDQSIVDDAVRRALKVSDTAMSAFDIDSNPRDLLKSYMYFLARSGNDRLPQVPLFEYEYAMSVPFREFDLLSEQSNNMINALSSPRDSAIRHHYDYLKKYQGSSPATAEQLRAAALQALKEIERLREVAQAPSSVKRGDNIFYLIIGPNEEVEVATKSAALVAENVLRELKTIDYQRVLREVLSENDLADRELKWRACSLLPHNGDRTYFHSAPHKTGVMSTILAIDADRNASGEFFYELWSDLLYRIPTRDELERSVYVERHDWCSQYL